ncbi:hypothetical protein BJ166DRAFT_624187 [Pestalotiopsis sp. NC0098]|nr:hypothetical protein BJ166DRAFT_624187 [Pestalotiopsis sp. NC0098]
MALDLPTSPLFEPTAHVPIVTPTMKRFLGQLETGCLVDIILRIETIAEGKKGDAEDKKNEEGASMRRLLKEIHTAMDLIHSIPKHLIKAAILGITAPLTKSPSTTEGHLDKDTYIIDGPGTYIATIAINGREGKFLDGIELEKLVSLLQDYIEAEKIINDPNMAAHQRPDLATLVYEIDSAYYNNAVPNDSPIYITSLKHRRKVEAMIGTLQEMREHAEPGVYVCQAPQYVGCTTTTITGGTKVYFPSSKWDPVKGNYVYWLVLSCLHHMGLRPDVVVTRFIRTWADGQLKCSETLGTMLAGSLVEERGYNVKQPGTTGDNPDYDWSRDVASTDYVHSYREENLAASVEMIEKRMEWMRFLEAADLEKRLQKHEKAIEEYKRAIKERDEAIEQAVTRAKEVRDLVQSRVNDARARYVHMEAIEDILTKLETTDITDVD